MKLVQIIDLFIILFFTFSCSEDMLNTEIESDIPVVEAFLEPGQDISLTLTKMYLYGDEGDSEVETINTASVYLKVNEAEYLLSQDQEVEGKYISLDTALKSTAGTNYELHFEYNGVNVRSQTTIPYQPSGSTLSTTELHVDASIRGPGSVLEPMTVSWENQDNAYHLIILEYIDSVYIPISEILDPASYDDFKIVATEPILGTSIDLDTRQHLVFFGNYRVIIYRVNDEYVDLYENISQSSLNLTEPLTNIENGLGIFTGVNSDTLLLTVAPI